MYKAKTKGFALVLTLMLVFAAPVMARDGADDPVGDEAGHQGPGNSRGEDQGEGRGGQRGRDSKQWVFRGTFNEDGSVAVKNGNGRVKKAGLVGTDVTFDFSAARIDVDDNDGDGDRDLADVQVGDRVEVKARLGRSDPGTQPYAAARLKDHSDNADDSGREDRPGRDRPGGDKPGGDRPGGDRPGGDRPGGDTESHQD